MALSQHKPTPLEPLWRTEALPFTVGSTATPHNPAGLPDIYPFALALDARRGLLVQQPAPGLSGLLDRAYATGSLLGTAMDDTALGRRYADDFLGFIATVRPLARARVLEIGAGRGYLLHLLLQSGADAVGIEPGRQSAPHWKRLGVTVIPGTFPSPAIDGAFDLVLGYAVLEHVGDLDGFLREVRRHLRADGTAIFSVPSCVEYIVSGDPSMLLHEHFSYFSEASLRRTLESNGFAVRGLRRAGYGGALYVAATSTERIVANTPESNELDGARAYGAGVETLRSSVRVMLREHEAAGRSVGIYCPARALALLDPSARLRFFDDDPELQGRFYPPFACAVESRQALIADPVDDLWIMSRTFGPKLRAQLAAEPALRACRIRLPDDLAASRASA
jgi:SAM-dependent methyltransferase